MKYIDEVDIELVNQELNFHTNDNSLVIKGGCDLFTTKPIGSDRKLYKTIDKHLTQLIQDNELSRTIERERKNSINSLFASSPTPTATNSGMNDYINGNQINNSNNNNVNVKGRSSSTSGTDHRRNSSVTDNSFDDSIDESPFGSLKTTKTKWTFANLIAILNTTFPDHDFSNLTPTTDNFHKITSEDLIHRFNNIMLSLGKKKEGLDWIWDRIDSHMHLIPKNPVSPTLIPSNMRTSMSPPLNQINPHLKKEFENSSSNSSNDNEKEKEKEFKAKSRSSSFNRSRRFSNNDYESPNLKPNNSISNSNSDYCQIFEFRPTDTSIIEDLNYPYQTMWSYYWFIYNKKKKKVSFIYLTAINKIHYSQINGNRKFSFRSSRNKNDSDIIGNDDDDDDYDGMDDVSMTDYVDEEVFIDDEDDDIIDVDDIDDIKI